MRGEVSVLVIDIDRATPEIFYNSHHRELTIGQSGPSVFQYKRGSLSGGAWGWLSTMAQAILSSISATYPHHQVQVNVHCTLGGRASTVYCCYPLIRVSVYTVSDDLCVYRMLCMSM